MKNFIDRLLRNPISFEITAIFVYSFYCVIFAVAAIPAALLVRLGWSIELGEGVLELIVFVVICSLAFYVFLVSCAIFVGFVERLLTLGLKAGEYPVGSSVFFRWLMYSGLHLWMVNLILPFIRGNNWIKIYLRIAGAKVGREVFVNTKEIYDAYLLEIGDNVIVGGDAFLNCHLFENGNLILGKIKLGDGTVIGGKAYITPGVYTGKNSKIGIHTYLRRNTKIRDGESVASLPGMNIRQIAKLMNAEQKKDKK